MRSHKSQSSNFRRVVSHPPMASTHERRMRTVWTGNGVCIRQMTGNWVAWQLGEDVRQGVLSMRLLRPMHPFIAYASSQSAALPFRGLIAIPVAVILLVSSGGAALTHDPLGLASALRKLESHSRQVPLPVNPAVAPLFIVQPLLPGGLTGLFSTHPPIAERIARLERMAGTELPQSFR